MPADVRLLATPSPGQGPAQPAHSPTLLCVAGDASGAIANARSRLGMHLDSSETARRAASTCNAGYGLSRHQVLRPIPAASPTPPSVTLCPVLRATALLRSDPML